MTMTLVRNVLSTSKFLLVIPFFTINISCLFAQQAQLVVVTVYFYIVFRFAKQSALYFTALLLLP